MGLPITIGLMVIALGCSLLLVGLGRLFPGLEAGAVASVELIDFDEFLMEGMLGFLLFAGALHVDINDLREQKGIIAVLATLGLLISTFLVGLLTWWITGALGVPLPFVFCLLFGALISPTDPIAVLAVLHSLGAPKSLETKIAGESLFNDGVAVVIFLAILGAAGLGGSHGEGAVHGAEEIAGSVLRLFALETLGGIGFGLVSGYLAYRLIRSVDQHRVEILLTLALAAGGYALALVLHVSGPIAMVVAGLLIGNHGRRLGMSAGTRETLDQFWTLVDEILNAVLFALIGLEVLVVPFDPTWLAAGLLAIPVVLFSRWIAVSIPVLVLQPLREFTPHAIKVLTWGGLRGGISVALALSLKSSLGQQDRGAYEGILVLSYVVVAFSIIVQGLSIGPLLRRLGLASSASADSRAAR